MLQVVLRRFVGAGGWLECDAVALGGRFSGAPPSSYSPLFICAYFSLIPFLLGRNSVRCGGLLSLFFVAPADVGRHYFGLAA